MTGRLTAVNELRSFSSEESVRDLWTKLATHYNFWIIRQATRENTGKYLDEKPVELFKAAL